MTIQRTLNHQVGEKHAGHDDGRVFFDVIENGELIHNAIGFSSVAWQLLKKIEPTTGGSVTERFSVARFVEGWDLKQYGNRFVDENDMIALLQLPPKQNWSVKAECHRAVVPPHRMLPEVPCQVSITAGPIKWFVGVSVVPGLDAAARRVCDYADQVEVFIRRKLRGDWIPRDNDNFRLELNTAN